MEGWREGGKDSGNKPGSGTTEVALVVVSELEKRDRRAERFGIIVMLLDEEKRDS